MRNERRGGEEEEDEEVGKKAEQLGCDLNRVSLL